MTADASSNDQRCDACGYWLRGLTVARCPECGSPFDPHAVPQADIPWLRREELGLSTAYVKTVSMILWRPKQFAAELCRPVRVSADDAYEFRLLTIFIASTSILLVLMAMGRHSLRIYPLQTVPVYVMAWVIIAAGLRIVSDLPTFIWSGLPRRASDLSPLHQYACAPLALVPLVLLPLLVSMMLFESDMVDPGGQLTPAAWLFLVLLVPVVVLSWSIPVRFMKSATGDRQRAVLLAVYLPIHWLIVASMIGLVVFTPLYFIDP